MARVKPSVDNITKQPNGNYHFMDPATGKLIELTTKTAWKPTSIVYQFSGDVENPTFSPAVKLINGKDWGHATVTEYPNVINHFTIQNGYIRYMDDSTHPMKGKTVLLPEMK